MGLAARRGGPGPTSPRSAGLGFPGAQRIRRPWSRRVVKEHHETAGVVGRELPGPGSNARACVVLAVAMVEVLSMPGRRRGACRLWWGHGNPWSWTAPVVWAWRRRVRPVTDRSCRHVRHLVAKWTSERSFPPDTGNPDRWCAWATGFRWNWQAPTSAPAGTLARDQQWRDLGGGDPAGEGSAVRTAIALLTIGVAAAVPPAEECRDGGPRTHRITVFRSRRGARPWPSRRRPLSRPTHWRGFSSR